MIYTDGMGDKAVIPYNPNLEIHTTEWKQGKESPMLSTAFRGGIGAGLSLIHISEPTRLGMISYAVF